MEFSASTKWIKRGELLFAFLSASAAALLLFKGNLRTGNEGNQFGLIFVSAGVMGFIFRAPGVFFGSAIGVGILAAQIWNFRHGFGSHDLTTFDFALLPLLVSLAGVLGSVAGFGMRKKLFPTPEQTIAHDQQGVEHEHE